MIVSPNTTRGPPSHGSPGPGLHVFVMANNAYAMKGATKTPARNASKSATTLLIINPLGVAAFGQKGSFTNARIRRT